MRRLRPGARPAPMLRESPATPARRLSTSTRIRARVPARVRDRFCACANSGSRACSSVPAARCARVCLRRTSLRHDEARGMARQRAQPSLKVHMPCGMWRLPARHRGVFRGLWPEPFDRRSEPLHRRRAAHFADVGLFLAFNPVWDRAPVSAPFQRRASAAAKDLTSTSASSWQEAVVPPGGAPTPPGCVLCVSTRAGAAPAARRTAPYATGGNAASPARLRFVPPSRRLMRAPLSGRGEGKDKGL